MIIMKLYAPSLGLWFSVFFFPFFFCCGREVVGVLYCIYMWTFIRTFMVPVQNSGSMNIDASLHTHQTGAGSAKKEKKKKNETCAGIYN